MEKSRFAPKRGVVGGRDGAGGGEKKELGGGGPGNTEKNQSRYSM